MLHNLCNCTGNSRTGLHHLTQTAQERLIDHDNGLALLFRNLAIGTWETEEDFMTISKIADDDYLFKDEECNVDMKSHWGRRK